MYLSAVYRNGEQVYSCLGETDNKVRIETKKILRRGDIMYLYKCYDELMPDGTTAWYPDELIDHVEVTD